MIDAAETVAAILSPSCEGLSDGHRVRQIKNHRALNEITFRLTSSGNNARFRIHAKVIVKQAADFFSDAWIVNELRAVDIHCIH
ncbi:hypothetical protein D3C72_1901050 [compost metagenome]